MKWCIAHHLHPCVQQLTNQWWAQGTFAQQNHYGCLPEHLIHRNEYRKDTAQKDFAISSDLNQSKYDLTNPIQ